MAAKEALKSLTLQASIATRRRSLPADGKLPPRTVSGNYPEVAVEVAGQTLKFTVEETGHFQNFIQRTIGTVDLPAGKQTLSVKPGTKPGAAVMDLRRVVLRPVVP